MIKYFSKEARAQRARERHRREMADELDAIYRRRRELDAREADLVRMSATLSMNEVNAVISGRVARGYA